ncbi:MAG TPA: caspase family protein [Steroidobacteraceae bacterium]|jgi:hypothetical protein
MTLRIAALLLCLIATGSAGAKNVALLIGVGEFENPGLKAFQLLGPAHDLDAVQKTLSGDWHFAPGDIRTLKDSDATHEHILSEISALEQRSAPGDTVLIYFSGHGTSARAKEGNAYDLPYDTGAWVPYDLDYDTTAGAQRTLVIGRRDLVPRLKHLDDSGRFVVVVSDSCYSGQVVRSFGQKFAHTRYLPLITRDLGVAAAPPAPVVSARQKPPPYPYQHVVLLSGASDSETGADISDAAMLAQAPTIDGQYHGAFTDAFLRLLKGQLVPGSFSYAQAREAMNAFLEHRTFTQHPQLLPGIAEDPHDVGSNAFLGAAAPPGPLVSPPPPPGGRDTTVHVKLESVSASLQGKIASLVGVAITDKAPDIIVRQSGDKVTLFGPASDPIVNTTASDPLILSRLSAQAWLNRSLPLVQDKLGLRADTDPASRGNTYVQCESFVFEVRLKKAAYLMVLDLDSQGGITVLYPSNALERRIIAANVPTAIPGADPKDHILVLPPFGTDLVTVLAFEKQPEFFAALTGADKFSYDSTRAQALSKGLANIGGELSIHQVSVNTYPATTNISCK